MSVLGANIFFCFYLTREIPRKFAIDLGANRKRICNFLLAINGNFGRISYRFRDIDA